jgi:hypothetical protein
MQPIVSKDTDIERLPVRLTRAAARVFINYEDPNSLASRIRGAASGR